MDKKQIAFGDEGGCHQRCGVCCQFISISSPIPGMGGVKPVGTPCIHLTDSKLCSLFGRPERPDVCLAFTPTAEFCGHSPQEAKQILMSLEEATSPTPQQQSTKS